MLKTIYNLLAEHQIVVDEKYYVNIVNYIQRTVSVKEDALILLWNKRMAFNVYIHQNNKHGD